MPVAIVKIFKSNMISSGGNPISGLVSILNALSHMSTLFSISVAYPFSSNAITTTPAPYFLIVFAFLMKSASPSFKDMLFTTHFPWQLYNPASMTSNLDESIMRGTDATSVFERASLTNLVIADLPSMSPSSTLISNIIAPSLT